TGTLVTESAVRSASRTVRLSTGRISRTTVRPAAVRRIGFLCPAPGWAVRGAGESGRLGAAQVAGARAGLAAPFGARELGGGRTRPGRDLVDRRRPLVHRQRGRPGGAGQRPGGRHHRPGRRRRHVTRDAGPDGRRRLSRRYGCHRRHRRDGLPRCHRRRGLARHHR
ncbi:hypothetical protein ETD85_62295, partial [Nonomuraea zeae]